MIHRLEQFEKLGRVSQDDPLVMIAQFLVAPIRIGLGHELVGYDLNGICPPLFGSLKFRPGRGGGKEGHLLGDEVVAAPEGSVFKERIGVVQHRGQDKEARLVIEDIVSVK